MTALSAPPAPGAVGAHRARIRMRWITWRQHRTALAGVAIMLGGCAVVLGITGLRMQHAYASLVRGRCPLTGALDISRCGRLEGAYYHAGYPLTGNVLLVTVALPAIPVLIGMFVAAPLLAREYEAGTFRFAWTQTAGPTRWVVAKLVGLGVALTAASGAFGVLVSWWLAQVDPLASDSRWQPAQFGLTAVTFAAWTVAAFAAGAFAGALIRRTVPAMAATGVFVVALTAIAYKKLDTLLVSAGPVIGRTTLLGLPVYQPGSPPVTFMLGQAVTVSVPAGSWPLRSWITGPHGQLIGSLPSRVLALNAQAENRWLAGHHLVLWTAYQPPGRFWLLQSVEGAAGLLLAIILGTATVLLVRRRAA
jgi:hypothetical protein